MFTTPWWLLALTLVLGFWAIGAYNRLSGLRRRVLERFGKLAPALSARRAAVLHLVRTGSDPGAAALDPDDSMNPVADALQRARAAAAVQHAAAQAESAQAAAAVRPLGAGRLGSLSMAEEVFERTVAMWQAESDDRAPGERPPSLAQAELELAMARQAFNRAVSDHNRAIRQPPASLLAALMGFRGIAPLSAGPGLAAAPPVPEAPAGTGNAVRTA